MAKTTRSVVVQLAQTAHEAKRHKWSGLRRVAASPARSFSDVVHHRSMSDQGLGSCWRLAVWASSPLGDAGSFRCASAQFGRGKLEAGCF